MPKGKYKSKGYMDLYRKIALEREPIDGVYACSRCATYIGRKEQLTPMNFAHIKSKGAYPELRMEKSNIEIICSSCHIKEHIGGFNVNNNTGLK